jgi:hypothetical protein
MSKFKSDRTAASTFGIFFITAFITYGLGSGLIDSIIDVPDSLSNIFANKSQIIVGVILIAIIHSFVNIGLPIIMFPILSPYSREVAYGYLSAAIVATVVVAVGAIFLLLLIPLSDEYVKSGSAITPYFETMTIILIKGGYFSYQIGMAIWGLGGLMFCYLLYQSKLVPRFIPIWGFIGYTIFISGSILELFSHNVGVVLSVPGGLFEIFLSLWLLFKGFNSSAITFVPAK